MSTQVVNIRTDEYDVYVGRTMVNDRYNLKGHALGNPFKLLKEQDRDHVYTMYESWLKLEYKNQDEFEIDWLLDSLKDKRIGCWCSPKKCHGDLLAKLADMSYQERLEWANSK